MTVLAQKPTRVDERSVGCILYFREKFLLFHRVKDGYWNSIAGRIEGDETPFEAIVRELDEEAQISLRPEFLKTTYHDYDGFVVEYNLYYYEYEHEPRIELNKKEHVEFDYFSHDQAKDLNLYPDELYCLELFLKERNS